jgi:hypothetical protein
LLEGLPSYLFDCLISDEFGNLSPVAAKFVYTFVELTDISVSPAEFLVVLFQHRRDLFTLPLLLQINDPLPYFKQSMTSHDFQHSFLVISMLFNRLD